MRNSINQYIAISLLFSLSITAVSGNGEGKSLPCPQAHVRELIFRVDNQAFKISGQTTVRTVYNTLAKTFPKDAANLALAMAGKPGWFHVTKRMQDDQLAGELFLCALHRKFGVPLPNNASLTLVKNFEKPAVATTPTTPTPAPAPSSLKPFFDKLQQSIKSPPEREKGTGLFALTTEMEIGKIRNLLTNAPAGLYVTLGGDRAFRGAALLEGIQGLLIFDIDTRTVRFNQINARLLKAKDLQHYRHLRWDAPFAEWLALDKSLSVDDFNFFRRQIAPGATDTSLLALSEKLNRYGNDQVSQRFNRLHADITKGATISGEDTNWYDKIKAHYSCAKLYLADANKPLIDASSYIRYKEGNYMFDEKLFERLRNLAVHNLIFSVPAQLGDNQTQDAIIAAFKEYNVKVSILDLDNGFLASYLGGAAYDRLVKGLMPFGSEESRLIAMANMRTTNSRYKDTQACSHSHFNTYLGFTFNFLEKLSKPLSEQLMIETFRKHLAEFSRNNWQDIKLFR